jgi:hypothetical protein
VTEAQIERVEREVAQRIAAGHTPNEDEDKQA